MNLQNRWHKIGALCFTLGGLQYLLAESVSALAWVQPHYVYSQNYISDLGIPQCGPQICSPLHAVMNSGFALEGILFFSACWLLRRQLSGWGRILMLLTGLLHAVGGVLIALFHSGGAAAGVTLHETGAVMAIGGGNLCLISVGGWLCSRRQCRIYSWLSLLAGIAGLLCMLTIPLAWLPTGLIERAAVYPITGWQILTGLMLLLKANKRYTSG
ncbi:DUF998 domain-containing protein [Erwiniaceae bacterium BAC15a-03b]|uniref:DUF998 domain-containing protein n=1 Tax=Winslowiella arboricola TaxID=2978220 RepID=A0A9J6PW75_9GAMM|nr:DUF998 domain-containing protein [Winslowiella arboricola]MCU5772570.1 DUF998 domain-containing protein [Winslowiella arboricola]MCU5779092.1 DUF998 domain-containing protein [Winslowiella arboricola]